MENQGVQYVLSLKDTLTGGLERADKAAGKLEGSLGMVSKMAAGLGIAAAGFAVSQFVSGSVEAYNKAAQSAAQLAATMRSTGNAAGFTAEEYEKQSKALSEHSLYDDDAITRTQGLLGTFTQIKGAVYKDALPAILDLSAKMGQDLQSSAVQVGKALNDPIAGVTALKRVGVSFTQSQMDVIKSLTSTGRIAEAQKMILAELKTEFSGSAAAAATAGTGPFTVLSHKMENVRERIGEIVVNLASRLLPILDILVIKFDQAVDTLKRFGSWLKDNEVYIKAVGVALGVLGTVLVALEIPTLVAAAAGYALSGALGAISLILSVTPLGWFIAALAAVAAGFYVLWQKSETFRAALYGLWEVIKGFARSIRDYFQGVADILSGIFSFDMGKIKSGLSKVVDAYKSAALDIGENYEKGKKKGLQSFAADKAAKESKTTDPNKIAGTAAFSAAGTASAGMTSSAGSGSAAKDKVIGNKSTSINVTIGSLIKEYNITTNNIKEAASKGREIVSEALLSAVNDFQITAGG